MVALASIRGDRGRISLFWLANGGTGFECSIKYNDDLADDRNNDNTKGLDQDERVWMLSCRRKLWIFYYTSAV
jgi:hypothetical protein